MFQHNYKTVFLSAERKCLLGKVLDVGAVDHLALEELDCLMRFRSAQQHGSEIREMGRCVSVITERTYLVGTGGL